MSARKPPAPDDELIFLALGGAGEIGMNLNLYGYGPEDDRQWLMLDCGVTFGGPETPGIDLICADPAFIEERADQLLAMVLTHGHEDHIGAVALIWPRLRCPIYATPFTASLVRGKLREAGLEGEAEVSEVPLGGRLELGPFALEFISLTHSIPEPNAVAIRTPLGAVFHTGDWKLDPDPLVGEDFDRAALERLGEERPLAMVCDSTNVFEPGDSGSEGAVREALIELIGRFKARVAVACFASNVARLETVAKAAEIHGRKVALVGRSMGKIVAAARENGYLADIPAFISDHEAARLPRDKALYLCTGSQGEPRAALMRIAQGSHPAVSLDEGDAVVFSSRVIPGNEVSVARLQNRLTERRIEVVTARNEPIHVSGHPARDELAAMYSWVRPQCAVPVHGELRHMIEHARLARGLQTPEAIVAPNGTMVRLAPGRAEIIDEAPSGRLYLDGRALIKAEEGPVQERRRLSASGVVALAVVVDEEGELLADPAVMIEGAPDLGADDEAFEAAIEAAVDDAVSAMPRAEARRDDAVAETARRAARRAANRLWGKKPTTRVRVIRLEEEDDADGA